MSCSDNPLESEQESLLDSLCAIPLPEDAIAQLMQPMDTVALLDGLELVSTEMNRWLETAHLTVFTLEQHIKNNTTHNTERLEKVMDSLRPCIEGLVDIEEILQSHDESTMDLRRRKAMMTITKLQSEWSGLKHFLSSVKKTLQENNDRQELLLFMETILLQINDLSILIFQFQERRHAAALLPLVEEVDEGILSSSSSSVSSTSEQGKDPLQQQQQQDDAILMEIDSKVVPLFHQVEKVYGKMTSMVGVDSSGGLARKHRSVQEKWESLRIEIDELKYDLKEDHWLSVFHRVANQVDALIRGLEKTVVNCYTMIQQARDWQTAQTNLAMQPVSKGILRTPKEPSNTSSSSSTSSGSANGPVAVDYNKFRAVEKAFETKFKYCTPSISRMLSSLGTGIASRVTRHTSIVERYEAMLSQWNQLKTTMDELRLRDLPDTERLLMFERPVSPAWSRFSDLSDKSGTSWERYRSPEPGHELYDIRSGSAAEVRSRRRSATPNSGRDMWRTMTTNPSPVFGRNQRTASPLSHARDTMHLAGSALRPSASDSSSVHSPSRKPKMPATPSSLDAPARMPWPTPSKSSHREDIKAERPKSSLGRQETIEKARAGTPSMIPRAKTPLGTRAASPCMIPRPQSSLARLPSSRTGQVKDDSLSHSYLSVPVSSPGPQKSMEIAFKDYPSYISNPKDPLDVEVATIVNGSPIAIKCQRGPHNGGYYFGNELNPSLGGGKKLYTCKLMNYTNRDRRNTTGKVARNKVLVRVGGGWQDLEIFLLEHSNLMASDVVVRSFVHNTNRSTWR
ncbi:hypothetical protein BDF14DRAFT_1730472 [Spinellus fusiger]|nr:hypothetical protein BDF14DRAFT_1730472 [Spinellus fusiger]